MALELVTESADSTYGCLLVHGRLAAATRNWHQLTARELCLLALYVRSARGSAAARDVSVFLPVKSPHVSNGAGARAMGFHIRGTGRDTAGHECGKQGELWHEVSYIH